MGSRRAMPSFRSSEIDRTRRRRLIVVLAVLASVAVAAIAGLAASGSRGGREQRLAALSSAQLVEPRSALREPVRRLRIEPAHPGVARVGLQGPPRREVALTFDDGFCARCVARIVQTLARTGAPATIFPNGRFSRAWDPVARTIRRLVAAGRLTIGNHTFMHYDAVLESAAALRSDLAADERWIERTFGVSARPFFRPPYGAYNSRTLAVAGQLGLTKVIMWSGTVADSSPRTVGYILDAIRYWTHPGAIILMHANYPATAVALPQILAILHQRGLRPVTLAQLLGA